VDRVRIDRWLSAARVYKSRTQASDACTGGRVKVNDESVKANFLVKVGDWVRASAHGGLRVLEVAALADKRLSPAAAKELFADHSPPPEPKPARPPQRERGAGRPTKREKRDLDRFRGRE
jgi:ribosome-associated heat shock protein Hsp15